MTRSNRKHSFRKGCLTVLVILTGVLGVFIYSIFRCNVSDEEAMSQAKAFCRKLNIQYSTEPKVTGTSFEWFTFSRVKEIWISDEVDGIKMEISCKTGEVRGYVNRSIENMVRRKYRLPDAPTEPRNWPPLVSEAQARAIFFSLAQRIGLPPDVEFSHLYLNKEYGRTWSGYWTRKLNGYPYENGGAVIRITAVDGEFISYGSGSHEPCPTEVKVTEEEAIEEGWRQVRKYLTSEDWKKHGNTYEVKSSDLKIVQPKIIVWLPWYSTRSRLAWVIVIGLKETYQNKYDLPERVTVKVDAATKKLLDARFPK